MKKLLLALLIGIAGIGLVACDTTQEIPKEDGDIVDVIPGEDDNKEEETPKEEDKEDEKPEIVDEDKVDYDGILFFGNDFKQNVSQRAVINVEGYDEIRISIVGNSVFDIPLNMNNWEVDGVKVSHTGVTETSYYTKHQFLIGEVNAVGNLINNFASNGDLRLHTQHADKGNNGYIKVDTTNVDEFAFDFKVTTGGFAFIESIRVDFLNTTEEDKEPEIIEKDKEPEIIEEDKEPEIIEEIEEPEIIEEIEEPVIEEDKVDLELALDFEINEFVVFEYYVKGGDSGHHYKDDYIILYNGTEEDINLEGMYLQYNSQGNFTLDDRAVNSLEGTVKSKEFFIILSKGGTNDNGSKLQFNYDYKINIALGGTRGAFIITDTLIEGVVEDNKDVIILDIAYDKSHKGDQSFVLNENKEYILKSLI